ncbi:MAG TPA: phosphodiesterase [Rhodospirillales bacterium]|jgi:3',5'-cyclic AMP phosphodiesterase CpdA|nr:phosphodiesterase [Rhodospirillales bacterium]
MIIAQISDFHLTPDGVRCHEVADSGTSFATAIARIARIAPPVDVVVATGDLVDFGGADVYRQLRRILDPLPMPVYLIPGNRDDRESLRRTFTEAGYFPAQGAFLHYVIEAYPLRLIGLDTVIGGRDSGAMCAARLAWLDARLAEAPDRPTIVFMHHPPFTTGLEYMDRASFAGASALEAIIRANPQIERVLCGHLHRPIQRRWAGTVAAVAPSTAFQMPLALAGDAPGIVLEPAAGYLHLWRPEIGLVTHLLPLADHPGPFPFDKRARTAAAQASADA